MNKKLTYILLLCTFLAVNAFAKKADKPLTPGIQLYRALINNSYQTTKSCVVVPEMYFSGSENNIIYTLVVEVDGRRLVEKQFEKKGKVFADKDTVTFSAKEISTGEHQIKLYVDPQKSNVKVSENSEILTKKTLFYKQSVKRQKFLVEQFTAVNCPNCPGGTSMLQQLYNDRKDVAWVALHNTRGRYNPFSIEKAEKIATLANVRGYPAGGFNRIKIDDSHFTFNINTYYHHDTKESISKMFEKCEKENPAFVNLEIGAWVNKEKNKNNQKDHTLDIVVKGVGVENAAKLLKHQKINVYVLENKLKSWQAYEGNNYIHNHVLRSCLTSVGGDNITWQGDNFTYKCTYNIPANYNPENMQVVAFVAPPINEATKDKTDLLHYAVNQTNIVDVKMVTNGIECIKQAHNTDEPVAYYNLSGQLIKQPSAHGVYMVKYKSGKIKKQVAM